MVQRMLLDEDSRHDQNKVADGARSTIVSRFLEDGSSCYVIGSQATNKITSFTDWIIGLS